MSMNKILDKLYLGNIKSASDLKTLKQHVSFRKLLTFYRESLTFYKWQVVLSLSFQT